MTRQEKARSISRQRKLVEGLRLQALRAQGSDRAALNRQLAVETLALKGLLGELGQAFERLSPEQARARSVALNHELAATSRAILLLEARMKKAKAELRHQLVLRRNMLATRKGLLQHRLGLLRGGVDLEQPVWLHPAKVAVQRHRLALPSLYNVPSPSETTEILRSVGSRVGRRQGESDRAFRDRLKAYAKRALVRYIMARSSGTPQIASVVDETIATDAPAIEAEADAGGVVPDPVADAMTSVVDAPESVEALTAMVAPSDAAVAAVTPEMVDQVVMVAEAAELQGGSEPPITVESEIEAAPVAVEPAPDEEEEEGEQRLPGMAVLFAGGIVVVLGYLLLSGRR